MTPLEAYESVTGICLHGRSDSDRGLISVEMVAVRDADSDAVAGNLISYWDRFAYPDREGEPVGVARSLRLAMGGPVEQLETPAEILFGLGVQIMEAKSKLEELAGRPIWSPTQGDALVRWASLCAGLAGGIGRLCDRELRAEEERRRAAEGAT